MKRLKIWSCFCKDSIGDTEREYCDAEYDGEEDVPSPYYTLYCSLISKHKGKHCACDAKNNRHRLVSWK